MCVCVYILIYIHTRICVCACICRQSERASERERERERQRDRETERERERDSEREREEGENMIQIVAELQVINQPWAPTEVRGFMHACSVQAISSSPLNTLASRVGGKAPYGFSCKQVVCKLTCH